MLTLAHLLPETTVKVPTHDFPCSLCFPAHPGASPGSPVGAASPLLWEEEVTNCLFNGGHFLSFWMDLKFSVNTLYFKTTHNQCIRQMPVFMMNADRLQLSWFWFLSKS